MISKEPNTTAKKSSKGTLYSVYGFPRIVSSYAESVSRPTEVYTRALLLEGHGHPIYYPYGTLNPQIPARKKATAIGDVGVVTTEGELKRVFNVFLPKDHPAQLRIPNEFEPFEPAPADADVNFIPNYHPPGTIITSPDVKTDVRSRYPWDVKFTSEEIQAGMLVLPEGADRQDLISSERYRDYIAKNAMNWYQVANSYGQATHPNGTLVFITGYDACDAFSLDAYAHEHGKGMEMRFTQGLDETPGTWLHPYNVKSVGWPYPKGRKIKVADGPHAIFLRGIRISLSGEEWLKTIHPNGFLPRNKFFTFVSSKPSKFELWKERMNVRFGVRPSAQIIKCDADGCYESNFHPALILGQILHGQFPNAPIALIEDHIWISFVSIGQMCTLLEINNLVARVLAGCNVVEHQGTLRLVQKDEDVVKGIILPTPVSWARRPLSSDWVPRYSLFEI